MRLTKPDEYSPGGERPSIASFIIRVQALSSASQLVPVSPGARLGWLGRVEHVQSGRSATFENPEEMITFMEASLGEWDRRRER